MQTASTATHQRAPSGARMSACGMSPVSARPALPRASRSPRLRCTASHTDASNERPSLRDRAAVLLTGLATSAMALTPGGAHADEVAMLAAVAAPAAAKPPMPEIPTSTRSAAELQAELEKRNAADLSALSSKMAASQTAAVKGVEDLQKKQADTLKQLVSELEASKAAAVKSVDELQKQVAAEHATMLQLQAQLRSAKAQLDGTQKDLVKERNLVVVAKESALAAKEDAVKAAAAARSAELMLRGEAGLATLKTPLGLAAASGWTLAAVVALAKRRGPADQIDWSKVEGKDEILAALEQARVDSESLKRESDALRRDLGAMQGTVGQLTKQLDQERTQRDTLRETILLLESEVSGMEQRMNSAKTEAATLKKKLDNVQVPAPTATKRPTLNEILTGQAARASQQSSSSYSNGASTPSSTSSFSSAYSSAFKPSASSNGFPSASPSSKASGSSSLSAGSGAFSSAGKYDASATKLGGSGRAVRIKFTLSQELPFGQALKLVGSHPALGAWEEARGLSMIWGDGHVWTAEVPLPIGTAVEFKAVKVSSSGDQSEWEGGSNHVLLIPDSTTTSSLVVRVEWGAGTAVLDDNAPTKKKEEHGKVLATAGAISAKVPVSSSTPATSSTSGTSATSSSGSASSSSSGTGRKKKWGSLMG